MNTQLELEHDLKETFHKLHSLNLQTGFSLVDAVKLGFDKNHIADLLSSGFIYINAGGYFSLKKEDSYNP